MSQLVFEKLTHLQRPCGCCGAQVIGMTLEESEAYCKKQGWYYDYSISVEQNKPGTLIFLTVPEKMPENVVKNGEVVIQYDRIKTRNGPVMIGTLQQWSRET